MLAMSMREERAVAQDLSPSIAWPTLRLALLLPLAQSGLIAGALTGWFPLWLVILPLGYIHFAYYTLVHESIHGNVARRPEQGWVHQLLGWFGSLNMMTSYPALRRIHLLHHQHTNTGGDPDYNLCHGPLWKSVGRVVYLRTLLLLPLPIVRLVPAAAYTLKQARLKPAELRLHAITVTALQLVFWVAIALGYFRIAFLLYWLPMMIGLVLLNVFFQWLPHVPFDKTDRYGKARVYWPFAARVLLGQNLHLGHHLWPSVPFYNYRRLNDRLRPQFESVAAQLDEAPRGDGLRRRAA
ncbi:MAG: beta-carotene hydroxylase [Sphingomonadales bacterium]|jgi:fatty acid desaturase|nr:beta-carotene hydroxylase [Sphingomonadales bacterium]